MDTIKFAVEKYGKQDASVAAIYINRRSLLDLVREVELPFAGAEGHADIAGGYTWLWLRWISDAHQHFYGIPEPNYCYHEKASILECRACGASGCWPFLVRIEVTDETVVWSLFEQPHRGKKSKASHWKYEGFGPFVFDRKQYDEALQSLGAEQPAT